jgi:hypothetical protein
MSVKKKVKVKKKAKINKKNFEKNATEFKIWCIKNKIEMQDIRRDTKLSIGCIHGLWNVGKANESTIKLISLVYKINEKELNGMVTTFVSKNNKAVGKN